MAKRDRLQLKRKVAQARNDIDRALGKVAFLYDRFDSVHPEHGQLLEAIAKGLILQKALLERFWEHTWGSLPGDWDSYVGDGRKRASSRGDMESES